MKTATSTHGHASNRTRTVTYISWMNMIQRCCNENNPAYCNYGGRGITVCDRWLKYENFLHDMGERQQNMSIERKDNNGNYCKDNCRWAAATDQCNNRRSNHVIEFNGEKLTLAQWSKKTGIKYKTLFERIQLKWSVEKLLTTEPNTSFNRHRQYR